jgi:uncharacterized membrane protein (UPF0127 family)
MLKKTIYCFILFLGCFALFSCKKEKETVVKQVKIEFKHEANLQITDSSGVVKKELQIELADNTFEQQTGLMYRKHLDQNKGMLFIFEDTIMRSFYMKNTYISLDLIYIDAEGSVVSIVKSAEPLNEKSLPSEAPAKYVLEINGGLSDTWGLIPGDKISYSKL